MNVTPAPTQLTTLETLATTERALKPDVREKQSLNFLVLVIIFLHEYVAKKLITGSH